MFAAALLAALLAAASPHVRTDSASAARLQVGRDAADGSIVLTLGPFDLPAHTGHDFAGEPPPLAAALPEDGWIRGYSFSLVDAAGHEVPRALLHHVNLIIPEQRELFSDIMLRMGAAGTETAPVKLPRLLGYRVQRGDSLLVSAMFHNPTATGYRGVRLHVRLPFIASDTHLRPFSIYPFYLDVMPPAGSHSFDVPPGHSTRSWEGKPAVAGRILGIGGHLHKYGTRLQLTDVTANRVLWEVRPETDASGEILSIPTAYFFWKGGVKIEPEHVYRITVTYDNPTGHTLVDGGMGALGGIFLPARGTRWPRVDRTAPAYVLDAQLTWRLIPQPAHHMEM